MNNSDPHHNIFYFYRGPQKKLEANPFDSQLENNVTKSLINVLELCSPDTALKSFLSLLNEKITSQCNLVMALWNPDQKYKLLMQTVPPKAEDFERKVVVTISKPRSETESSNDAQTGGLPDAWILGDLNLGILIESKLQSKPDEQQIQGHLEKVKWNNYQYARVDLTWPEVYQCMKACLNEQMNEKDKFLIDQFNRYLELVGMSPFSGFENADFDLFTNYEELKDYSPFVKTKMNDFAKQVHLKLPNKIREKYPIPKSGNIYDLEEREIWIAFQIKKDSKNPFQHCNLNSVIDATGIRCAAVIRDGKYVDKKKPIGILYDKLNDPNSLKKFEKILSNLGKGFSLVINRRTDKYGGERVWPSGEIWNEKARYPLDNISKTSLKSFVKLLEDIHYPGIRVQRDINRGEDILKKPEELINSCSDTMVRLSEVLDFLY